MNRTHVIDFLTRGERDQLARAVTNEQRNVWQQRLDTNRTYLAGQSDDYLQARVALEQAPLGRNVRCSCDGSACSCEPLVRRQDAGAVDPTEAARNRMIAERRAMARADAQREDARNDGSDLEAARNRMIAERRAMASQPVAPKQPPQASHTDSPSGARREVDLEQARARMLERRRAGQP